MGPAKVVFCSAAAFTKLCALCTDLAMDFSSKAKTDAVHLAAKYNFCGTFFFGIVGASLWLHDCYWPLVSNDNVRTTQG